MYKRQGYKPDSDVVAQIKVIARLFRESDSIIVATDAGREGELIFRYLYEYIGCATPFERLWISSLTDTAIREGLERLESGNKYDNLYYAAKARSEADWLVGINATQAITVAAGRGSDVCRPPRWLWSASGIGRINVLRPKLSGRRISRLPGQRMAGW